ncbi:POT family MFS transporter [Luteolibacter flavescens]|uniref:POT family MFS transporter n=1 Tax=Luteolibacter flavescens TaxID=1859460 RepID=A0ABT3FMK9_9BACT|nr:POT family MFS transporter [Luteolibacter flavescens]MCW1884434.1 POT family MFS transporter [Luteolibacter flavescens]
MSYRTNALDTDRMPPGIPFIIGNEAAERFSFYGMRTILVVFMTKYLWLMDQQAGSAMSDAQAREHYHDFVAYAYLTPFIGALFSDVLFGKYRTILWLSIFYCLGHLALALMGTTGSSQSWLFAGLILICIGSGGIKPCVSAHVGDQFGPRNSHLLTRVFNWFYFSINFGSFFSTLLTPWLLEHYGPHWAFGIPGGLMALATLVFWMGRHRFVHVPPAGLSFFKELGSKEGLFALAKLIPLFLFIAVFWGLYDQTGSSWVQQAAQMDLNFMGITWLESQIQAANPILILTFVPLFSLVLYPLINRVFKLTPLRKIGFGLFLTVGCFALSTLIQSWIDKGNSPSIGWQLTAFVILTAAEVMVSIVGLEFSYTQAPKSMKSLVMAFYLAAVFIGNKMTAQVNEFIQIPSAAEEQLAAATAQLPGDWKKDVRNVVLPGLSLEDPADDMVAHLKNGAIDKLDIPGQAAFTAAAAIIEAEARKADDKLPDPKTLGADLGKDFFGNPIRYEIIDSSHFRLISDGADRIHGTKWDMGLTVSVEKPAAPDSKQSWLEKRKTELGITTVNTSTETVYSASAFCGGQTKLEGAAYFRFFTWLMLGAAVLYVPFAMAYRPRTYLHD